MFSAFTRALAALAHEASAALTRTDRVAASATTQPDDDLLVARLRSALAISAQRPPREELHLRRAVREFVLAERSRGVLVERVIIALKQHVRETVFVPRGDPVRDTMVGRVVGWCIDDYFHSPR